MKMQFVLAALIISIIAISGCSQESARSKTCCDYARSSIPDNITLVKYFVHPTEKVDVWSFFGSDKRGLDDNYSLYWRDGTKFDMRSICFMQGVNKDQNVNIYYEIPCVVGGTTHAKLSYSRKVVNSSGDIKGDNYFSITPILARINGTEKKIKLYNRSAELNDAMDFRILDYTFSSCYWINGSGQFSNLTGCSKKDGGSP